MHIKTLAFLCVLLINGDTHTRGKQEKLSRSNTQWTKNKMSALGKTAWDNKFTLIALPITFFVGRYYGQAELWITPISQVKDRPLEKGTSLLKKLTLAQKSLLK